ncbi:MAG: chemotaxis protein CheB, partial [Chloroflexota bacterium]
MERKDARHLVVVGSSAGGVDALTRLVATLPADFPAPIVMAQHLDPNRPSHLPDILARSSQLPVRSVEDGEHLAGGTVYVVPSHRNVEVRAGAIHVAADGTGRPQPSIDLLLATAAKVYGERLTAVILTGSGSDGADGARRVKAAGGTVVVQNPDSAQFPSMPASLAPTTIDIVAELDAIGPLLADLVNQVPIHSPGVDGDEALDDFLGKLRDESGIDFANYKRPTIIRRLRSRLAATGSPDLERYLEHVWEQPDELQRLTSSFLLKVTEFFRDPAFYERLRAEWLPELVDDARRRGEELRIWSAGCATGEEAYSVAMLVAELRAGTKSPPDARIFATDLDDSAIAFARRGIYPTPALDNVPADLRERYATVLDGQAEVTKGVRSLVVFGQHDLGARAPFPAMDLILCRNVLIYFQPELQQRTLQMFAFSLRHGGYLALGKAETTASMRGSFELVDRRLKVYRRAGKREAHPTVQFSQPSRPSPSLSPTRHVAPALDLAVMRARRESEERRAVADRTEGVLLSLRTGVAVVDERYDMSRINAAAREML